MLVQGCRLLILSLLSPGDTKEGRRSISVVMHLLYDVAFVPVFLVLATLVA